MYQDHSLAELPLLVHKYSLVSLLSRSLLFLLQAFRLVFSDLVSSLALYLVPVLCFLSLPELIDIFLSLESCVSLVSLVLIILCYTLLP